MSESSRDLTSGENNILGPDYFSFYTSEVKELLSQDDDLLPFVHQMSGKAGSLHEVGREKGSNKNGCLTPENNSIVGSSLFSNGIGAMLSEAKKEKLKSLLRQSVSTLTQEVDEMISPVLSVCRIRSCLRCKESLLSMDATTNKTDQAQHPHKKLRSLPANDPKKELIMDSNIEVGKENVELDDDLRFILENDSTKVEQLMEIHSGEISTTLHHMEQKLEEILNILMTSCRAMTISEKQQLCKSIKKLPPINLDRVAEIIDHNKPSEKHSAEVHVELNSLDNATLWRLYFYVTTTLTTTTT